MAETPVAANNKSVKFTGRPEREMSSSWTSRGISESDGSTTSNPPGVNNTAPMKKKLSKGSRKHATRAVKRGLISEKAAKRHLDGV